MCPGLLWALFPPPHLVPGSQVGPERGSAGQEGPPCREEGLCPASQGLGCRSPPQDPLRAKGWEQGREAESIPRPEGDVGAHQGRRRPEWAGVSAWPLDVGPARRLGGASAPPPWPRSPPLRSLLRAGFPEQAAKGGARKRWPHGSLRLRRHLNPCRFCPSVLVSVRRPAMAVWVPAPRILLLVLLLPPPPGGEPRGVGAVRPGQGQCVWEGGSHVRASLE